MTTIQPSTVPASSPFGRSTPRAPNPPAGDGENHRHAGTDATAEPTGVRFTLHAGGKAYAAVITAKALVEHFGARADSAGLLACYRQHSGAIHRLAARKSASTLDGGVLISAADFSPDDACPARSV